MFSYRATQLLAGLEIIAALIAQLLQSNRSWSQTIFLIYVGLLALTISTYAMNNLQGQHRYRRFGRFLFLTTFFLYLPYFFHNQFIFLLCWIASGWGAVLLTNHFADHNSRRAAGKLFFYFLIGDVALACATIYLARAGLNFYSDRNLPLGIVLLIALAGIVRSGIFPFQNWLALTNEAPSPLSALLHAGIVNGFGMALILIPGLHKIRLTIIALSLITIFNSLSIMRHRHDEKGKLANGTSMQMAYMAIEGAIGLPGAALLHLIGHGAYKSWSFLRVGGAPNRWKKSSETNLPIQKNISPARVIFQTLASTLSGGSVVLLIFFLPKETLALSIYLISLTSFLLFIRKFKKEYFLIALAISLSANFTYLAIVDFFAHLPVGQADTNIFLIRLVSLSILLITLATKIMPERISLKIATSISGFNLTRRAKENLAKVEDQIKPDNLPLIEDKISELLSIAAAPFTPGRDLPELVSDDPVAGLHELDYFSAATLLSKYGISAYQDLGKELNSTSPATERRIAQIRGTASWWCAEAITKGKKPFQIWQKNSYRKPNLLDPKEMIAKYLQRIDERDPLSEIAKLIALDFGWFTYLLSYGPEWIEELLALRAALVMSQEIDLAETKIEINFQSEQSLRNAEKEVAQSTLQLLNQTNHSEPAPAQTAFITCIDVRSEKLRRYLENSYSVDTLGFAGFFGADLAIATGEANQKYINQLCPVILNPSLTLTNSTNPNWRSLIPTLWKQANSGSGALAMAEGFGLVELFLNLLNTFGNELTSKFSQKIGKDNFEISSKNYQSIDFAWKVNFAKSIWNALPLARYKEVIFVGHKSAVPNNPFKSLYECGACGGNSGEVNAQLAAMVLNDQEVLAAIGIKAAETKFATAIHDTTKSELIISPSANFRGGEVLKFGSREKNLSAWWQAFPEFGLAANVGAIIGPRLLSKDLNLGGKYFLHDYDYQNDPAGSLLINILNGPGQVMQMINAQYNFTVADPEHFGSGDKTRLNVFTKAGALVGSGGKLVRGLPWQALGRSENEGIHKLIRLQIFVAAPSEFLEKAIAQSNLAQLVANGWISVHALF